MNLPFSSLVIFVPKTFSILSLVTAFTVIAVSSGNSVELLLIDILLKTSLAKYSGCSSSLVSFLQIANL